VRPQRLFDSLGRLGCVIAAIATSCACAAAGRDGQSSAYLIVDSLVAASGARPGDFAATLDSDVATMVDGVSAVAADTAQVTFSLAMKDPRATAPSAVNAVTVRGYRVAFVRADDRNVPGVHVPYPFEGALTLTVRNSATSASFVLVRAQAKLEAPLAALAAGGGAGVISTIAEVTFYGQDQAGRDVAVTARIAVAFSDWPDVS